MKVHFIHESHLDLFWLGTSKTCLNRGSEILKQYIDRCQGTDETYLIETVVFLKYFLEKYPEYTEVVQKLWQNQQVDFGVAYVDVWQNLVLGESHIRNIVEGQRWLRDRLGINSNLAVHPDLPGIFPQVSQVYRQGEVDGYVTSRKIYQDGAMWTHQAPDGSKLKFFNHPHHYIMPVLVKDETQESESPWFRPFCIDRIASGFPKGTVVLSGGAGDLADMRTFVERYGQSLPTYIEEFRKEWPEHEFSFGRISELIEEYDAEELPVLSGEIPSVWGVACDESVEFFHNARYIEGRLLTVEKLLSLLKLSGDSADVFWSGTWQGALDDNVFFGRSDFIPAGQELCELWKMHLFSQDHNGGGKEGAGSEFIKLSIQRRLKKYTDEIIKRCMQRIAPAHGDYIAFNPNSWEVQQVVRLPEHASNVTFMIDDGQLLTSQRNPDGGYDVLVHVKPLSVTCIRKVPQLASKKPLLGGISIHESDESIVLENETVLIRVNKTTGNLTTILDKLNGQEWGHSTVGQLLAYREYGNDVTLKVDESHPVGVQRLRSVYVSEVGNVHVRLNIEKEILGAKVVQQVTLWRDIASRLDVETTILWHGEPHRHIRMDLPWRDTAEIGYGTPFFESSWDNVVPGSGPYNPDEISKEDWSKYREAQLYFYLKDDAGSVSFTTFNPGLVKTRHGLASVLLRTSPSCGDPEFIWHNAGKQAYSFTLRFSSPDETAVARHKRAYELLQPLVVSAIDQQSSEGPKIIPHAIEVAGDGVILSAMYPESRGIVVRLFEANGEKTNVSISSPNVTSIRRINILGNDSKPVYDISSINPYEIQTLLLGVKD